MSTLDRGLVISLLLLVILHATPATLQLEQGEVLSHRIFRTRQTSHYDHVNVVKVSKADEHTALGNDLLKAVGPSSESVISEAEHVRYQQRLVASEWLGVPRRRGFRDWYDWKPVLAAPPAQQRRSGISR